MTTRSMVAVALAALSAAFAGCGGSSSSKGAGGKAPNPNAPEINPAGDIPDNQVYVRFAPGGGRFSLKVPEGWAQTSAGPAVSFTDKLNTITMQTVAASAAPTVASVRHDVTAKLASTLKGFPLQGVGTVSRPAGTAVRAKYLARSMPDPVTGKVVLDAVERYVFFHRGRDLILTLSGPKGADNVDPWKLVSSSVRWTA